MLIAFQIFSSKLFQLVLRLVGLWQQFQQFNLSVQRLSNIMNAPTESSIIPIRLREGSSFIYVLDPPKT